MSTRERAINLRDWEVRAIQAGRLKMLVRPVEPQPPAWVTEMGFTAFTPPGHISGRGRYDGELAEKFFACPYGKPGDQLRGREAWWSDWRDPGVIIYDATPEWGKYQNESEPIRSEYPDGTRPTREICRAAMLPKFWNLNPADTMPCWAVRNWLEITEVRCGRVREMSEYDGWDCGIQVMEQSAGQSVYRWYGIDRPLAANVLSAVATLYETDHGEGSWERDWVWMIGVKRIEGGV